MLHNTLVPLLLFVSKSTIAAELPIFSYTDGACYAGDEIFDTCDYSSNGGLCASVSDLANQWCCNPGDVRCVSYGQYCTGQNDDAGPGQIHCSMGSDEWCCNAEYEDCVVNPDYPYVCRTTFGNQLSDTSREDAISDSAVFFATATIAPPGTSSTGTNEATNSPETNATKSATTTAPRRLMTMGPLADGAGGTVKGISDKQAMRYGKLSGGAVAGIVVAIVATIVLVAVGFFFVTRFMRKKKYDGVDDDAKIDLVDIASPPPQYGQGDNVQLLGKDVIKQDKIEGEYTDVELPDTSPLGTSGQRSELA